MSTIIDKLKDKFGNFILPVTNVKAVYDDDGNRLDNLLKQSGGDLISDAYDSSKTYLAGQYCIYNNVLWKSKVDSNIGNAPTEGTYWTATSVGKNLITTNGEGKFGYLGADDSFIPFKNGEEPILLWTKPDGQATPLDTNLATFIPLDLLEYDAVIIEGVYGVVTSSGNYPTFCTFVRKNENGTIFAPSGVNSSSDYVAYRNVKVSSNGLTFLTGWSKNGYNATRSAMPLKVWGVRTEFEVVAPSSGNLLAELDISSGVYGNTQPHILYNHNNLISLIANGTNKWDWIFNREVNISFIEIDCIGYTSNQCNIVIDGKVYLLLPNVNGYNGTYRYYIGATIPSGYKYNVMSAFGNSSWRSTIRFYTYDDLD